MGIIDELDLSEMDSYTRLLCKGLVKMIQEKLFPDDVFTFEQLDKWAKENGYKNDDVDYDEIAERNLNFMREVRRI